MSLRALGQLEQQLGLVSQLEGVLMRQPVLGRREPRSQLEGVRMRRPAPGHLGPKMRQLGLGRE